MKVKQKNNHLPDAEERYKNGLKVAIKGCQAASKGVTRLSGN